MTSARGLDRSNGMRNESRICMASELDSSRTDAAAVLRTLEDDDTARCGEYQVAIIADGVLVSLGEMIRIGAGCARRAQGNRPRHGVVRRSALNRVPKAAVLQRAHRVGSVGARSGVEVATEEAGRSGELSDPRPIDGGGFSAASSGNQGDQHEALHAHKVPPCAALCLDGAGVQYPMRRISEGSMTDRRAHA